TGVAGAGDDLHPADLQAPINTALQGLQQAAHLSYASGTPNAAGTYDRGLALVANAQRAKHCLFRRPDAGRLDSTRDLRLSEAQKDVLLQIRNSPSTRLHWIEGPAGSGKSTLTHSLIDPTAADDPTIANLVGTSAAAAVFVDSTTTADAVCVELAAQLHRTRPGFADAHTAVAADDKTRTPLERRDTLTRELLDPLTASTTKYAAPDTLMLDGFDQAHPQHLTDLTTLVHHLSETPVSLGIRVIVGSRVHRPPTHHDEHDSGMELHQPRTGLVDVDPLQLDAPGWNDIGTLITNPAVLAWLPSGTQPAPAGWLAGRLASALTRSPWTQSDDTAPDAPEPLAPDSDKWLGTIARAYLAEIMQTLDETDQALLVEILELLRATPPGPALPLDVLEAALSRSDTSPSITRAQIRTLLVTLGPLVQRGRPGHLDEHVGYAHDLLRDQPPAPSTQDDGAGTAHAHLADALGHLLGSGWTSEPVDSSVEVADHTAAYAAAAWADHCLEAGRPIDAVFAVRVTSNPARPLTNVGHWTALLPRITSALGPEHPDTLT
ncbi:MAG: hypothetical protein WA966_08245, partial [Ornithinimicrobium sp.]